ncbi:toll-like receptor 4 [Haliotis cracherodii]|uniref:toll-like receptor 4 n=1 Tax=Haliotis cracherodii TaxID=6455 RepID=UPI0039E9DC09
MMFGGLISIYLMVSTSLSHDTILNVAQPGRGCCLMYIDPNHGGTLANCTNQGLQNVPTCLPRNTTTLLLSHNNIPELPNQAFVNVSVLKVLDLSFNSLQYLNADSFFGLSELESLNLESNCLSYDNNTFTPTLFNPLSSLLKLSINYNSKESPYPDVSLSSLTSLQSLHMDGSHYDFGQGFRQLKNLSNLTLSGSDRFCNMHKLRNTTFSNVPFLKYLNLTNCGIVDTEHLTFSPMKGLYTLDVSLNPGLGFKNFSKAYFALGGSAIKVLKLNYLYPTMGCHIVQRLDFQYLNTTNLEELYIDGNGITQCESKSISSLPQTLKFLSARANRFAFGLYLLEMAGLKSLEKLDLSLWNIWPPLPLYKSLPFALPVPPKLHTIVAENCFNTGQWTDIIASKNILKRIILRHNIIHSLTIHIEGLEHLKYVDLSHNTMSNIGYDVFNVNNTITHLNLSNNILGQRIQSDGDGNLFHQFHHVKQFDISENVINSLPRNIFRGLKSVETLIIRSNFLQRFEATLKPMQSLYYLDLANNKLQRLSMGTIQELDMLPNVTVNLRGNPIQCSCQALDFLKWMNANLYKFRYVSKMTCEYDNGSSISMTKLHQIVEELKSECNRANAALGIVTASSCVCIVLIICVALGYRHRWSIKYMYYIGRRRFWRQYQYDVFVSYAESDRHIVIQEMIPELETKEGLRMCIHHRDFLPGEPIASNIVNAIDKSRKTLIVLSPAFLKSDWCVFEYHIALQSRVNRRQDNLLILMYEHVPVKDVPREMAVLLSNNSYLEYNTDVYGRDAFWQNLVESVKTAQPLE